MLFQFDQWLKKPKAGVYLEKGNWSSPRIERAEFRTYTVQFSSNFAIFDWGFELEVESVIEWQDSF